MLVIPNTETRNAPGTPNTVRVATPIPTLADHPRDTHIIPPDPLLPEHSVKGTQLVYGEAISVAAPARNVIDFGLVASLRRRKLYAYLFVNPAAGTEYMCKCDIDFYRNFTKIGTLPLNANLSTGTNIVETVVAAALAGGNAERDCIAIYLSNPVNGQVASNILQPQNLMIEADRVTVSVNVLTTITNIRLWIGVLSSET